MYDELMKRLRECTAEQNGEKTLWHQAADAIESTSKAYQMMAEAYEAEVTKQNWIPVTERLPDIGKDVLCFCRAGIYFVLAWDGTHWHEGADRYYMSGFVSHWMPLPQPPKEETNDERRT